MGVSNTYAPVDTKKFVALLKDKGVISLRKLATQMGRNPCYINQQLKKYCGINKSTVVYLQIKYNINPDDYKPESIVATTDNSNEDKLFKLIYRAAYTGAQDATKPMQPVQQQLCAACYHKALCTSFICRIAGGIDNKVRCDGCGKYEFGATYEILPR